MLCHRGRQLGGPGELRVGGQQRLRGLAGRDDRLLVAQHPEVLQAGPEAGLRAPEDVALAALLEVDPAELEAVGGGGDGVEPLAGVVGERSRRW